MSFRGEKGIVLGHGISSDGIEVDKAKIDLIANLPPTTNVEDVRSFLGHAKSLINLPAKNVPFHFSKECSKAFTKLKEALTTTPFYILLSGVSLLN